LAGVPITPAPPYMPLQNDIDQSNLGPFAGGFHQNFDNSDLVLSDVISFEVKVLWDVPVSRKDPRVPAALRPNPSYSFTYQGQNLQAANSDYPFDYLPLSPT